MTAVLHPARARRMVAKMPPQPHHDAVLRPLGGLGQGQVLIVSYSEPSYLDALFADLSASDWQDRLVRRQDFARDINGVPRLSPPVHARTNVVLYELACRMPGSPPVAPSKIESMGFVLRRHGQGNTRLAWRKQHGKPLGWHAVSLPAGPEPDPDPARQMMLAPGTTDAALHAVARLRNASGLPQEEVLLLHRAPPDICAKLGKTVLFATLPLASSERSPAAGDAVDYANLAPSDAALLDSHLSRFLRQGGDIPFLKGGQRLEPGWRPAQDAADPAMRDIAEFLRQCQNELGLASGSPAANSLLASLNSVYLPLAETSGGTVTQSILAGTWLLDAGPILLGEASNRTGTFMPLCWPARSASLAQTLTAKAKASLSERARQFQPDTPKFDRPGWLYSVKPFVRLSHGPQCPVRLVWGEASRSFKIRPWWDSDAPPVKIGLPDIGDLRNVKPNVAFEMPPMLANLLTQDPKKLADGEGSTPSGIGLGWLCSFSLPIITICAFIVLNIFLQLFNIIFSWLLWIKICIPIPVPKEGE